MTSDIIALSKGVRSALLSSQTVAAQQADASARLGSGLKVNSALDSPTNFFTSRSLNARATELNGILDGFGNARSQIQAAVDAQEKALKLIDVAEAARQGGWQALKRGEFKNLTRVATSLKTDGFIRTSQAGTGSPTQAGRLGRLSQLIVDLNAAGDDATRIAAVEAFRIDDFHNDGSAGQQFYISVGENEDFSQARYLSTNTGNKTVGTFIADLEANIPNLNVEVVIDRPAGAAFDVGQVKLQLNLPERDDRAIYMTGWFNIFQDLNVDHGIYWSEDPDTEKALLSFEPLAAGWETQTIGATPGFHTSIDGYAANNWVLNDGVNPDLQFAATPGSSTLGDFVDYVNTEHAAGRFGFRMEQIQDASDPDNGKLKVFTDGSAATQLLFKPRLSDLFYKLRIDGTSTGGSGQPFHIQNTANPPNPGIPAAEYDIDNSYWDQFEAARTQIDDIISDGGFAGIALGTGQATSIALNERGSRLTIRQDRTSTQDIGLARAVDFEFQMFDRLDVIEGELAEAREAVKSRLTQLQNELAIVEVRETFTKNLINVLRAGSSKLVLADPDEEGANLLASNTRQQLTGTALQLASQSDRSVLRLF